MTTIVLPWPLADCINANHRIHWAVRSRRTRALRQAMTFATMRQAPGIQLDAAHLTITVGWPDRKRRDVANWSPTFKAAIDGAVDAGLLPDDSDAHLTGPDLRPEVAGERGLVVLTFNFEPRGVAA